MNASMFSEFLSSLKHVLKMWKVVDDNCDELRRAELGIFFDVGR